MLKPRFTMEGVVVTVDDELNASVRNALDNPPTAHKDLAEWVAEVARMTQPDDLYWVQGTDAEYDELTSQMVDQGKLVRLNEDLFPHSFAAFSDPDDVARVEERTFVCSLTERDAGPTNKWKDPLQMEAELVECFTGSMRGRTMYVVPFVMGSLEAQDPKFGVEVTDSPYVVASMKIMSRIGQLVLEEMADRQSAFVRCLHSVGMPLAAEEKDVPWPSNPKKYIVQFPDKLAVWSFGSGYGGNALLGKKCFALRIASVMGRDEGWMAEHMLLLKLTYQQSDVGKGNADGTNRIVRYLAGAFPSACGKTNLAMIEPNIAGWKAEMLGDDIVWMHAGEDGRLYGTNPETGLFGVAPGTGWQTNPNAMRAISKGNTIFTNVALTEDGGVWWEGMTDRAPEHLTDWRGNSWTPESDGPAAHPNARFCTPIDQVDTLAPEYYNPDGVPISAILFGGRRKETVPLVTQAFSWNHGVFMGATLSSETTAAADGEVGVIRRDPMAMLPFIGYNIGDYFKHWIRMSSRLTEPPQIFCVNWFRRDSNGGFLWPGFGENARVLEWIIQRISGCDNTVHTPVGRVPRLSSVNLENARVTSGQFALALAVNPGEWRNELVSIWHWFDSVGDSLPSELWDEFVALEERLA